MSNRTLAISLFIFLVAFAPQEGRDDLQRVMGLHRRSLGGFDAAISFTSARRIWELKEDGKVAGTMEETFAPDGYYRQIIKSDDGWSSVSFDGQYAYIINPSTRMARSPHGPDGNPYDVYMFNSTRASALMFPLFYAEQFGANIRLASTKEDRNVVVAEYPDGAQRSFTLDQRCVLQGDTLRLKRPGLNLKITREYSGFDMVEGAYLPTMITITTEGSVEIAGAAQQIMKVQNLRLTSAKGDFEVESEFFTPGFPHALADGTVLRFGDQSFRLGGDVPTGDDPESVRAGDMNGDGHLDLVTGDDGAVSLLIGDGSGHFRSRLTMPAGGGSNDYALPVDFNGDGILDLAMASTDRPASTLFISKGLGSGKLAEPKAFPTGDFPEAIAAADFDGDGHLDLAVAYNRSGDARVHYGDGKGGIAQQIVLKLGAKGENLTVADLNKDGKPDLLVVDQKKLTVFLNSGGRSFTAGIEHDAGPLPFCVASADFNGDGNADVLVGNGGIFRDCGDRDLALLIGDGTGGLASPAFISAGGCITGVDIADFDGNGQPDAAVSSFGTHECWVLLNSGGVLRPLGALPCSWSPSAVAVADLNEDNLPDIAVANEYGDNVTLWFGIKR